MIVIAEGLELVGDSSELINTLVLGSVFRFKGLEISQFGVDLGDGVTEISGVKSTFTFG